MFARDHLWQHMATTEEDPFEIYVQYPVPFLFGLFDHRLHHHRAGIVHQDIDFPETLDGLPNHSLDIVGARYICKNT
jgi:hypothetical protein